MDRLRRIRPRMRGGLRRNTRGQSLAEFALAVPMLLLLVIGMVEFARGWMIKQVITNVAREGARLAVLPTSTQAQVQARVDSLLATAGINPSNASVTLTTCDGTGCTGQTDVVQVQVPYQFTLVAPVLNLVCGGSCPLGNVNLTSTSQMRNE